MKKLLIAASCAALLLSSTAAFADKKGGHGHGGGHGHSEEGHPPGKHKGWHKKYNRGERIERVYLEPRYYVEDYRHYHLAPPPHGHRWVRHPDGRYLLVAVATGIIADILLHH